MSSYSFTKELLLPSNLIYTTKNLQILPLKCATLRLVKIHDSLTSSLFLEN